MDAMRLCMLFFCFFLAVVSAVKILNDTDDFNNVDYGKNPPRHRHLLLDWFSQQVRHIDQNGTLTLDLNPTTGDFGFHCFKNWDGILLPLLSRDRTYYTVGNLNYRRANTLPYYVQEYKNTQLLEANMDRIIISVDSNRPNRVFNVYTTSHNLNKTSFNASDTYEITSSLIEQVRDPHVCTENQNNNYFIFRNGNDTDDKKRPVFWKKSIKRHKRSEDLSCDKLRMFKLEIRSNEKGYSKLIWKNLPAEVMKKYYVYIEICKNNHSVFNSEDECQSKVKKRLSESQLSGTLDTSVPLNGNLQPRLLLTSFYYFYNYIGQSLTCYGAELDDANKVIPTRIMGCDASLQLYVEDGWASARLYIKKTFSNWKNDFNNAWVGFYTSSQNTNNKYDTYQWATKFKKVQDNIEHYDIYKYQSNLVIAPEVQIRFFLHKNYNNVLARTTPWKDKEEVMVSPSDCSNSKLKPKILSGWSSPEFFYSLEFYDANRVNPTQIKGFDSSLQLYTKDGKACARLYIKKTFKNWKNAFYYSWVGFYSDSQKPNNSYNTYEYAIKFDKVEDIQDFVIYIYKSSLTIAPGVQIRFLQDKQHNSELARTPQWKSA